MVELITRTSTDLPPDVRAAMRAARRRGRSRVPRGAGAQHHRAEHRRGRVLRRTDLPGHRDADLRGDACRSAINQIRMKQQIREAVPRRRAAASCGPTRWTRSPAKTPATISGPARRSSTSSSGKNRDIEVRLILKGGGCENTNAQYALPTELDHLGRADRSLDGVRKCILHAVWKAQGKGCSPGAVGVCVGGDRDVRLLARERAAVQNARRHQSRSAAGGARRRGHGRGEPARGRADGIQRQDVVDRMQDRRAQSAARELLRVGRVRLLGVPPARRPSRRADWRDYAWLYREDAPSTPMLSPDRSPPGSRAPGARSLAGAAQRRAGSRAEGGRRRADLRPRCSPAAMPCTRT